MHRLPSSKGLHAHLTHKRLLPSWQDLYESILDAMVRIHRVMDGGSAPDRDHVRQSIGRVALANRVVVGSNPAEAPYFRIFATHPGMRVHCRVLIRPRRMVRLQSRRVARKIRQINQADRSGSIAWAG